MANSTGTILSIRLFFAMAALAFLYCGPVRSLGTIGIHSPLVAPESSPRVAEARPGAVADAPKKKPEGPSSETVKKAEAKGKFDMDKIYASLTKDDQAEKDSEEPTSWWKTGKKALVGALGGGAILAGLYALYRIYKAKKEAGRGAPAETGGDVADQSQVRADPKYGPPVVASQIANSRPSHQIAAGPDMVTVTITRTCRDEIIKLLPMAKFFAQSKAAELAKVDTLMKRASLTDASATVQITRAEAQELLTKLCEINQTIGLIQQVRQALERALAARPPVRRPVEADDAEENGSAARAPSLESHDGAETFSPTGDSARERRINTPGDPARPSKPKMRRSSRGLEIEGARGSKISERRNSQGLRVIRVACPCRAADQPCRGRHIIHRTTIPGRRAPAESALS